MKNLRDKIRGHAMMWNMLVRLFLFKTAARAQSIG